MDDDALARDKTQEGHLFIIPPQLENNKNIVNFHTTFFKVFCYYKFLYAFLDYKISGKVKDYMRDNLLLDDEPFDYNQTTNEIRLSDAEEKIGKAIYYTNKRFVNSRHNRASVFRRNEAGTKGSKTILDTSFKTSFSPPFWS